MKKLFDFIKSPKFYGLSCVGAAGFIMGLLITYDNIPFWVQILDIVVFWTLTVQGCYILNKLDFDKQLNLWIKRCYNEQIYGECDRGEKEFDIDIPSKIADDNYTKYVGKKHYFTGHVNNNYVYVITDARPSEYDITYTTITFTKIKGE